MYNKFFEVCEYLYEGFGNDTDYIAKCVGVTTAFVTRCVTLFDVDMSGITEEEFEEFFR